MFRKCVVCGLLLPVTLIQLIQVKHQGRIITVGICNPCKQRKETETKGDKK